jgi:hypothetical protein
MSDIQRKASASERLVNEITHDVKKLDYAKRNLQQSITALKNLQLLVQV